MIDGAKIKETFKFNAFWPIYNLFNDFQNMVKNL